MLKSVEGQIPFLAFCPSLSFVCLFFVLFCLVFVCVIRSLASLKYANKK